ncbi:MAG: GldG family protein [SAR324 cluster bacterium]|nr:GldG family protein [SAR324 cluster bacterium]
MMRQNPLLSKIIPLAAFLLLAVGLVAVNVLFAFIPMRLDITDEGLFTLSDGSRNIVANLEEATTIKLYYSADLAEIPVSFKTYSTKVIELVRRYAALSKGKLSLEIFDPKPDTDEEDWASRYGLEGARLPTGNTFFFGMVVLSAEREEVVKFFDPRREKFLEYDISRAISRVGQADKVKLGLLTSLPMAGYSGPMGRGRGQEWTFITELRKEYAIEMISPGDLVEVPKDIKMMLVIHPKNVTDSVSYALDQFLLRGGKLLVMVDPNSRLDPAAQQRFGMPTNSDLKKLFSAWGIQFDATKILGDLELPTRVNSPQDGVVDYPIWVSFNSKFMNREQVITADLEEIALIDTGVFSTKDGFSLKFTPLINSSKKSAMVDFASVRMLSPSALARSIVPDGKERVAAALLTGSFKSAYPGGPPPPPKPRPAAGGKTEPPKKPALPHLTESKQESSVVLIGDVDFISDQFSIEKFNFFGNVVAKRRNDNFNLVFNAVDFLAGSQDLIYIRSRGRSSRPFTKVSAMLSEAADKFAEEETRLSTKLETVKAKLEAIEKNTPKGQKIILTRDQLEEIKAFQLEEERTKKELRKVRKNLRQKIKALGSSLLFGNLLAMPLLVALVGFVVLFMRNRRKGGKK